MQYQNLTNYQSQNRYTSFDDYAINDLSVKLLPPEKSKLIIAGYASIYNLVDYQNDIVLKNSFQNLDDSTINLLWQHDTNLSLGFVTSMVEDHYGLYICAYINLDSDNGKAVYQLLNDNILYGLSVSFEIINATVNQLGHRLIHQAKLKEISIVTKPANRFAKINIIQVF